MDIRPLFFNFFLVALLACTPSLHGQIQETFPDSLSPHWQGDRAYFAVVDGQLQSQGPPTPALLCLSHPNRLCDSSEWVFSLRLDFNPSSTNFVRIYLMADASDLREVQRGYYLQLGESGGKNRIHFFRQDSSQSTLLFSGRSVFSSSSGCQFHLRMRRSKQGEWLLESDPLFRHIFTAEAPPFTDDSHRETLHVGLYFKYATPSRAKLLRFDDLSVQAWTDTPPPDTSATGDTLLPAYIPKKGDLAINEVLFDASDHQQEYVELLQRGPEPIPLSQLAWAVWDSKKSHYKCLFLSDDSTVFWNPGDYLLLTKEALAPSQSSSCLEAHLLPFAAMPSLSNEGATITIVNRDTLVIDAFTYHPKMHYPLLRNTQGVALERLRLDMETKNPNNWHSASESSGFGTPGCPNSQKLSNESSEDRFQLPPQGFSPNGDGINDLLEIAYQLEETGHTAHLRIVTLEGKCIREIANNCLLGSDGFFYWDGLSDSQQKVAPGVYILVIQLFSLDKRREIIKKAVCVSP